MIRLLGKLPQPEVLVACSGGVDSVVAWDFLNRTRKTEIVFFHHGTRDSHLAFEFLNTHHQFSKTKIHTMRLETQKPRGLSWEEFWRIERLRYLNSFNRPVVLGHHLDDALETYVWRMCNGRADTIPYRNQNLIRPFLLNTKQEMIAWAKKKGLVWVEDQSNENTKYTRNFIRKNVIPGLLTVNPGLHKIVARKIIDSMNKENEYVTQ